MSSRHNIYLASPQKEHKMRLGNWVPVGRKTVGLFLKMLVFAALITGVGGCNVTTCSTVDCDAAVAAPVVADVGPGTTATLQDADDVKYFRSDEPLRMAIEHFNRGHYGIAERYFR